MDLVKAVTAATAILTVALLSAVGSEGVAAAEGRVLSSELVPGVHFRSIRLSGRQQQIAMIRVAPWAPVRAVLATAGEREAPFATVSSAVGRLHGLAGVNGYFTTLPGVDPMLVLDGRIVAPSCGRPCVRDPRTGFGLTEEGTALLVTVDGRRADATGMSLWEFAVFLRSLGAVWAVNLDGGASTTMVVGGIVANTPADQAEERPVSTALVLLPSARPGVSSVVRRLHEVDDRIVPPAPQPRASRDFRLAA